MSLSSLSRAAHTGVDASDLDQSISDYRQRFDPARGGTRATRHAEYTELVNGYYDLVTDFYEYGWGQSFHFAARRGGESVRESILRHEHYLALQLGLGPGDRVVDVGCGVGGPMRALASLSGSEIVGVNNNAYQVQRGETHTREANLEHLCSFVRADFMAMPLDDESFDGAYQIEATCHAPDRVPVYSEIHRVLRAGARFTGYEWCLTDRYDPGNPDHREIIAAIEEGDGIPELRHSVDVDRALGRAGFEILRTQDLASTCDPATPWYLPLTGRERTLRDLPRTRYGRALTHTLVRVMERVRLAPKGSAEVSTVLNTAADALVRAGQLGIFTPMYFYVARKSAD